MRSHERRALEIHEAGHLVAGWSDGGTPGFVAFWKGRRSLKAAVQWPQLPANRSSALVAGYAANILVDPSDAKARKRAAYDFEDWKELTHGDWAAFEAEARAFATELAGSRRAEFERAVQALRGRSLIGPLELAALAEGRPPSWNERVRDWWNLAGRGLEPAFWAAASGGLLVCDVPESLALFLHSIVLGAALVRGMFLRCQQGGETDAY